MVYGKVFNYIIEEDWPCVVVISKVLQVPRPCKQPVRSFWAKVDMDGDIRQPSTVEAAHVFKIGVEPCTVIDNLELGFVASG